MTHTESNPASSAVVARPATCSNKSAGSNPEKLGSCTPNFVITPTVATPQGRAAAHAHSTAERPRVSAREDLRRRSQVSAWAGATVTHDPAAAPYSDRTVFLRDCRRVADLAARPASACWPSCGGGPPQPR